ncbi:MAG: hypothetical protein A2527_00960 [Candidatus Lambdaproteobacteria bacterium RIFOXYD2_FULL_50_16]|uniref:3-hydroxyacyl-[acyl-carrier-protein] dehydratase FabZ n=1 Tax=Candidatus Lambdaproteobacteria bacterium RIFOXYD2_FULL_50_16 TaxID=1817772 RepID=A0A1F6G9L0_9PROT|nr:MAG: hypothetical protein A2527_00960 [Candidatus Lambdaproteobacteria bacterium RIFOXYD2_FULL_50_16]
MCNPNKINLNINEIKRLIPQRYPFLFVDQVLSLIPKQEITVLKNLTANEPYFQGHFPDQPIMPGVLACEAMAQASAILLAYGQGQKGLSLIGKIKNAHFKFPLIPGDSLQIHMKIERELTNLCFVSGEILVGGQKAVTSQFIFSNQKSDHA